MPPGTCLLEHVSLGMCFSVHLMYNRRFDARPALARIFRACVYVCVCEGWWGGGQEGGGGRGVAGGESETWYLLHPQFGTPLMLTEQRS